LDEIDSVLKASGVRPPGSTVLGCNRLKNRAPGSDRGGHYQALCFPRLLRAHEAWLKDVNTPKKLNAGVQKMALLFSVKDRTILPLAEMKVSFTSSILVRNGKKTWVKPTGHKHLLTNNRERLAQTFA
jgi:hypothetical protein